ncbi:hydroxypyruvate isomerase family protein [Paenibacillus sp. YYML68]|uniref:hydroxypyruvate isomerase family protein n=1 Tax=Paenibacillus sp. YYML68 TaxID=2909250 RepID=UPI0024919AF8|nr:TIM barrel protein [Paenibacillus sp. YYML68]
MKLSVCIEALFREMPLEEKLHKVKEAGFGAFEFWSWDNKDIEQLARTAEALELTVSAFCVKQTSLTDAAARPAYLEGLKETLEVARRLHCRTLIVTVGAELAGVPREVQRQSVLEGLRASVPLLEGTGVTLVVEPLNVAVDHPGYFLSSSEEAQLLLQDVGHPQVRMLFDIYHQQVTEGHVTANMVRMLDTIGHVHAAGNPGRRELDEGELHYPYILRRLHEAGYGGYVGLEYFPVGEPMDGLRRVAQQYAHWL